MTAPAAGVLLDRAYADAPGATLHVQVVGSAASARLPLQVWAGAADSVDGRLLARVEGPTLDVGCGPGRLLVALRARGVPALGVDTSRAAVARATAAGVSALRRSVFDPLPGEGRWASALLCDGNVGIGGDPVALLRRVVALVRPGGQVLAELAAPTARSRAFEAWLVAADGTRSRPFPWASVSVAEVGTLADMARLRVRTVWRDAGRWFADAVVRE